MFLVGGGADKGLGFAAGFDDLAKLIGPLFIMHEPTISRQHHPGLDPGSSLCGGMSSRYRTASGMTKVEIKSKVD